MDNLSVLVFGGSVSGGGGVGNHLNLTWHAQLGTVRPTVYFKGAISPSYYLHCTTRFVDHAYDAVVLDLGANMFGSGSGDALEALIHRVRCLTNATSTAIVDWHGAMHNNASRVAAARTNATLLDLPRQAHLYAADHIHPNARGHALIAERVRTHLAHLPRDAVGAPTTCAAPAAEACFALGTDLPVEGEPRDWTLVDDSPTPDLTHKYGWATTVSGANLSLAIPPLDTCGAIVTLAYLASKVTGSFLLSCSAGCACSPMRNYHQKRIFPFPIVTGHEDCDVNATGCHKLKITRDTAFDLLRTSNVSCRLTVTALTSRRVRIDGLYVQSPSEGYLSHIFHSPSSARQRRFAEHALDTSCA